MVGCGVGIFNLFTCIHFNVYTFKGLPSCTKITRRLDVRGHTTLYHSWLSIFNWLRYVLAKFLHRLDFLISSFTVFFLKVSIMCFFYSFFLFTSFFPRASVCERGPFAIILAPTRELAQQVQSLIVTFSSWRISKEVTIMINYLLSCTLFIIIFDWLVCTSYIKKKRFFEKRNVNKSELYPLMYNMQWPFGMF